MNVLLWYTDYALLGRNHIVTFWMEDLKYNIDVVPSERDSSRMRPSESKNTTRIFLMRFEFQPRAQHLHSTMSCFHTISRSGTGSDQAQPVRRRKPVAHSYDHKHYDVIQRTFWTKVVQSGVYCDLQFLKFILL